MNFPQFISLGISPLKYQHVWLRSQITGGGSVFHALLQGLYGLREGGRGGKEREGEGRRGKGEREEGRREKRGGKEEGDMERREASMCTDRS